ncbi:hypothetical protein [Paenibacillus piscarius]|uniref:hypothetical protein n=1 Tax=Paenibacillus piscarius TaxID=1089681 RepID=UPI001EE7D2D1|nr:hypothetical protein [Paenibacillus piscarius]
MHKNWHKGRRNDERLLLQFMTIRWEKEVRGAPFSTARNNYKANFTLPDTIFTYDLSYGLPFHHIVIAQNKTGFEVVQNKSVILEAGAESWIIGCVKVDKNEREYQFSYHYSKKGGKPVRYDQRYNPLSERAFGLGPNEYGRISYNGRYLYQDTGEWYYELNTLNALVTCDTGPDVFISTEPVKEYKQIEILY